MNPGKYTIKELLVNREVDQIVIPEIQRDYVWGKEQVEGLLVSLLEDFANYNSVEVEVITENDEIKKLFINYLKKQQFSSNIGFVYAYNDPEYKGKYFIIDGQQRLTTVYLLILALSKSDEQSTNEFRTKYFKDNKLKIDYKVRESSHDFLVHFMNYCLIDIYDFSKDSLGKFKDRLEKQNWYLSDYENDKTIQSIISNYIIIASFLENKKAYIVSQNNDNVKFLTYVQDFVECWYFDTNISEQGEELYIYMNARGEQIQNNENIKADLLGALKKEDIKFITERNDYTESLNLQGLKNYWGKKWEKWQDFFWINKINNENADNGFNEFLRWIQIIKMINRNKIDVNDENENSLDKKNIIEIIKWEKKGLKLDVSFLELIEIEKYIKAIELLFNYNEFPCNSHQNYKIVWDDMLELNWLQGFSKSKENQFQISQIDCFRLLPLIEFTKLQIENKKIDNIEIIRFARFLLNLSRQINISKAANINCINAVKLVSEINGNISNIIICDKVSTSLLTIEEKAKFNLYVNSNNFLTRNQLEETFWSAEDLLVFKGEISFIFDCINFDMLNYNTFNIHEFKKIFNVFKENFSTEVVSDQFRKALLVIGDYKTSESYTWSLGMNRYHLCETPDEWNNLIKVRNQYLKKLITILGDSDNNSFGLEQVISNGQNELTDWRLRYINLSEKELHYCQNKRICVNDTSFYLLKTKKVFNDDYFKKIH